jgi:uncharacterized membrane protein
MRYVNGVLGYVLIALGVLIGALAHEPTPAASIAVAGAVLIAGERICDGLRGRPGP